MKLKTEEVERCHKFESHYACFCQLVKGHNGPHAFFWGREND